jgi:hypothetical protein
MTNPTSNFGWQMPTSTDLVTDLPADFEVFGQAVDTSMADLKGGTSGQVLSKNSNTDMDFVWVTSDDANAIQNAIVDAKGDLITATAADTPARLAVGTNGQTLVADSSTATGLKWATAAATSGPAFRAKMSAQQSGVALNTATKVIFDSEDFDPDSCYDATTNYRFTPNKSGYYQITTTMNYDQGSVTTIQNMIYKNGSKDSAVFTSSAAECFTTTNLIYFNGTTDYVEAYVQFAGTATRSVLVANSSFSGVWIRS